MQIRIHYLFDQIRKTASNLSFVRSNDSRAKKNCPHDEEKRKPRAHRTIFKLNSKRLNTMRPEKKEESGALARGDDHAHLEIKRPVGDGPMAELRLSRVFMVVSRRFNGRWRARIDFKGGIKCSVEGVECAFVNLDCCSCESRLWRLLFFLLCENFHDGFLFCKFLRFLKLLLENFRCRIDIYSRQTYTWHRYNFLYFLKFFNLCQAVWK